MEGAAESGGSTCASDAAAAFIAAPLVPLSRGAGRGSCRSFVTTTARVYKARDGIHHREVLAHRSHSYVAATYSTRSSFHWNVARLYETTNVPPSGGWRQRGSQAWVRSRYATCHATVGASPCCIYEIQGPSPGPGCRNGQDWRTLCKWTATNCFSAPRRGRCYPGNSAWPRIPGQVVGNSWAHAPSSTCTR